MTLRDYERRWEPELAAQLGEPILRCIALNAATMSDRMRNDSLTPFWRPQGGLPQTMFLILTPTRAVITAARRSMAGYEPVLSAPILTLARSDAEITAVQDDDGLWLYSLRSRASGTRVDLELKPYDGIAAELAGQLRQFTPGPVYPSGLTASPAAEDTSLLSRRRRYLKRANRSAAIISAVFAIGLFGFGAFQLVGYHTGKPTTATIVRCSHSSRSSSWTCHGDWSLEGKTYTGEIQGVDDRLPDGSTVDIHVSHGIAFSGAFPKWVFIWGAIFGGGAIFLALPSRPVIRRRSRHGV
jgi:hypothetical protein